MSEGRYVWMGVGSDSATAAAALPALFRLHVLTKVYGQIIRFAVQLYTGLLDAI